MENKRTDGFWKAFSIVLLVVLVGVVAAVLFQRDARPAFYQNNGGGVKSQLASLSGSLEAGGGNIYWVADLAEQALPFVVNIQTSVKESKADPEKAADVNDMMQLFGQGMSPEQFRQFQQMQPEGHENHVAGEGSGFIIREDGYVVTNMHVVDGADTFDVRMYDGKEYEAELIGTDTFKDIALLKIKSGDKFPIAVLGESGKTRIGEPVVAIGSPLGLKASVTAGIISTTDRSLSDLGRRTDIRTPQKYLQTDAAINRGNSGGPLLNARGEVIGVNQAIARWDQWSFMNSQGGQVPIEGIGFAIPIDDIKNTITQIMTDGKVIYPGISAGIMSVEDFVKQNENAGLQLNLKVKQGVYVQSVTVDGPAGRAGVEGGDVILSINGQEVTTADALITEITKHKVGDRVKLRIARQGGEKQEDVSVVLSELDLSGHHPGE